MPRATPGRLAGKVRTKAKISTTSAEMAAGDTTACTTPCPRRNRQRSRVSQTKAIRSFSDGKASAVISEAAATSANVALAIITP